MATKLDIAVLAAAELTKDVVANITTPQTGFERAAAAVIDLVWRETLASSTAWMEARRSVTIAKDGSADATPPFDYLYRYRLPVKLVRLVRVFNTSERWVREGQYILTDDAGPLKLVYIHEIEPEDADPLLISAAAARLAWRVARRFTDDPNERDRLWGLFNQLKAEAQNVAGSQGQAIARHPSTELEIAGVNSDTATLDAVERSR